MTKATSKRTRELPPIGITDFVRFAGASGDFNPNHHDDSFARASGFPSIFAMGMLVAGELTSFVADSVGLDRVRSLNVRFRTPTWPGDVLVLSLEDDGSGGEISAATQSEVKVSGRAVVGASGDFHAAPPTTADGESVGQILAIDLPDVVLPVERGQIMQFARAVKSDNPAHFDIAAARAAGFGDLVAPPAFTCTYAHWSGGDATDLVDRLGLSLPRVVHGEHQWDFARPAVAGDVLTGARRVASAARKPSRSGGSMSIIRIDTEYHDSSGDLVLIERQTLIELPAPA